MLESIFNETAAISTAQHQICLIALPPDFQVGQARPLNNHTHALKHDLCHLSFVEIGLIVLHSSENLFNSFVIDFIVEKDITLRCYFC